MLILPILLFLPIFTLAKAQAAAVYTSGSDQQGNATLSEQTNDDAFIVGNTVGISAPVGGELFAAGNTVSVTKRPSRSIYVAGNVVSLDQGSAYNAFVAGNTVTLNGTYGHDVYAAGNTVIIKEGTVIDGDLRVAGSVVTIAGTIKGSVYASANQITNSGIIGGSFSAKGGTCTFVGRSIAGDLNYQSANVATGLTKVVVSGKTMRSDPPQPARPSASVNVFAWLISLVSTFILGAFLIALIPKRMEQQAAGVRANWGKRAAVGGVSLIIIPILIMLAFATIIGWKVGLVLLVLFALLLLVGYIFAVILLGQIILQRFGKKQSLWLSLVVGLVSVSVLSAIPLIGGLISLLFFIGLVLPSFGFLILSMRRSTDL